MKINKFFLKAGIIFLVFIISFGIINTKTSYGQCPFSPSYTVTSASTPAGTIITPPGSPTDQGMGGAIITVTNPAWPVCSNWGYPTTMPVLNGYCMGAPTYHNLTFNSLDPNTNLNNGLMCFTGTTTYRYMNSGGVMITDNAVPARVRIRVTLTDGVTPIPIQQAGSYLLLQTHQNFRVWYFIEAYSPINAQYFFAGPNMWLGAINLFNALHTDPASYIQTTFDYGAYYNINGIGITAGAITNPVCYLDNIDLTGSIGNLNLACTTPTYVWSGPNGFSSTSQNPSLANATPIMSGIYTYAVSDLICYGLSTINILVYDDLTASISGGTSPICYNSSPGTFTATGSGGTGSYTYLWYQNGVSTGVTTQTYNPGNLTTTPNTYYCEVSSVPCGTVTTSTTQIDFETVPPVVTCPANVITTTNNGCSAINVSLGTPVTSDNCDIASVTNNAPAVFPLGNTTVTWTVADGAGNITTCDQTVTVNDNVNPTIFCMPDIEIPTDAGSCTASGVVLTTPVTLDNCSVSSVTNDAPAVFPLGATTVTWTVTDGSANTATCTQQVTVIDNIVPTITCPADVVTTTNTGCTATGVSLGIPTTNDNCSVSSVTNNAPAAFPLGITTVIWTVTDGSGNTATCAQLVTVNDDVVPSITCPADIITTTNDGCTAINVALGTPVTADNCSVASVTNNAPAVFPLGNTTVTWTVTDGAGNIATCNQLVTVNDNINPTIFCLPDVVVNTDAGVCTASGVVLGIPVTSDNCSVSSVTNDAPAAFPLGATTVTWTVTDGSANTATCTQQVTV
ncbi:MAG TPA: HYR domain-containing protein, partial [Bacteroidales bacterium]|nr:HYR domain-containing protein [Bacteroidales bacterium]